MEQSGIFIIIIILLTFGMFAAALFLNSRSRRTHSTPSDNMESVLRPNDVSIRSPAGSMAARREDIEDLLRDKEGQPGS